MVAEAQEGGKARQSNEATNMIWASVSVVALYMGLLNSLLARYAGTCTQGNASHLLGIVFSIPFFLLAMIGLFRTRYLRATIICSLPALAALAWQCVFAARLLIGTLVYGFSACEVLQDTNYEFDGLEATYATLWSAVMFTTFASVTTILARRLWTETRP